MSQISELAALCGVSEQAIRKYCSQHKFRKLRNQWNLTETQYSQVLSHYGKSEVAQPAKPVSKVVEITRSELESIKEHEAWLEKQVESLSQHLHEAYGLIKAEQEALEKTQELFSRSQQLHAATVQELNLLIEARKPSETEAQPLTEESRVETVKRGWFARLFG